MMKIWVIPMVFPRRYRIKKPNTPVQAMVDISRFSKIQFGLKLHSTHSSQVLLLPHHLTLLEDNSPSRMSSERARAVRRMDHMKKLAHHPRANVWVPVMEATAQSSKEQQKKKG